MSPFLPNYANQMYFLPSTSQQKSFNHSLLTLSLINNDIRRLELLVMMRHRCMMMSRTGRMVLYGHHLSRVHVHAVPTQAGRVFILY